MVALIPEAGKYGAMRNKIRLAGRRAAKSLGVRPSTSVCSFSVSTPVSSSSIFQLTHVKCIES